MANKIKTIHYGEGGFDESKPDNNVIEIEYYTPQELAVLEMEEARAQVKAELLSKLGITEEEAKLLLG